MTVAFFIGSEKHQHFLQHDDDEERWQCLAWLENTLVACGSNHASFIVIDCRLGYAGAPILQSWSAPLGYRLLEMRYCRQKQELWTLEQNGEVDANAALELVRYRGRWQWCAASDNNSSRRRAAHGSGSDRIAVQLPHAMATMRLSEASSGVVVSLPGGIIEVWASSQQDRLHCLLRRVVLGPVLGVSTERVLFSHVSLIGDLLIVGVPTDVWLVQLHQSNDQHLIDANGLATFCDSSALGSIVDCDDMLHCALPRHDACVKSHRLDGEGESPAAASPAVVFAHLSYHRPRCSILELKGLGWGEDWAYIVVVAGRAAFFYEAINFSHDAKKNGGGRPSVIPLAEIGFNTTVLQTTVGNSREYPWLFALTLSGIEVWSIPPSASSALSPCRLLVQRLEYQQRLGRLPPIDMVVAHSALILLANPPGYTPPSLPDMLFHTVPRPSAEKIPEIGRRGDGGGRHDGAWGESYGILVLHMASLAGVYRALKGEVQKAIQVDQGAYYNGEGDAGDEEEIMTRFVEGEMLDSSVYGIQPQHVVHHSAADLMAITFALLEHAAAATAVSDARSITIANADGCSVYEAIASALEEEDNEANDENDDGSKRIPWNHEEVMNQLYIHDARQLYTDLAKECATMLGDMWLLPRAEGVVANNDLACEWYVKSDTSAETLCSKLLPLWDQKRKISEGQMVARPLLQYLEKVLSEDIEAGVCFLTSGVDEATQNDEVWKAVVHFVHEADGDKRLEWLILHSRLPWGILPQTRQKANALLEKSSSPDSQKALLALAIHDLASWAAVQGQVTVQLDNTGNSAWVEVPGGGMEGPLGLVIRLSEGLEDKDLKQACLRAPETIIKHLVMQGLPLVVKGPFFPYLESERPEALACILADVVTSCHHADDDRPFTSFDSLQILRLFGPYGTNLSHEMNQWLKKYDSGLNPNPPELRRRRSSTSSSSSTMEDLQHDASSGWGGGGSGGGGGAMAASRQLTYSFLNAKMENVMVHGREDSDPLCQTYLICAELIGLDLDAVAREGVKQQQQQQNKNSCLFNPQDLHDQDAADWFLQLAPWTPCPERASIIQRLAISIVIHHQQQQQQRITMDWDVILRWLFVRLNGGSRNQAHAAASRLVRLVCLAELGRAADALDLLLSLLLARDEKKDRGHSLTAFFTVFMGFGRHYYKQDGSKWGLALSKIRQVKKKQQHEQEGSSSTASSLHDQVLASLSDELPPHQLLQAFPDDGDVKMYLEALESILI